MTAKNRVAGTRSPPTVVRRGLKKHELTEGFCDEFASLIASGKTLKIAALTMAVPPGLIRQWLRLGEEKVARVYLSDVLEMGSTGYEGRLWLAYAKAVAERDGDLLARVEGHTRSGEAAFDQAAAWKLERFDPDEFRPGQKIEVTGAAVEIGELQGGPTLGELAAFLRGIGVSDAGGEVPGPAALLPAPADRQPAAARVPQPS